MGSGGNANNGANIQFNFSTNSWDSPYINSSYADSYEGISEYFGDNIWRLSVIINYTNLGGNTVMPVIYFRTDASNQWIGGAQLERASFPTSYIPTSGSAVTRQPDTAQITGTNFTDFYNATGGTIFFSGIGRETDDYYWSISNNTVATLLLSATSFDLFVNNGGSTQAAINTGTTINTQTKVASAYKANDFAAVKNNQTLGTDTSGVIPTVDRLRIGTHGNGTNHLNGYAQKLIYYPARISDIKLQQMTKVFS